MSERPYRWFDHTADLGMEIRGDTLAGLFSNAAQGLYDLLGAPFRTGTEREEELTLEGSDHEELLRAWLGELLYRAMVKGLVYSVFEPEVHERRLRARLRGGVVEEDERRGMREVKAVTYHELRVRRTSAGWKARVIFDV